MSDGMHFTPVATPNDALITLWTQVPRWIRFGNLVTIHVDSARIEYHEGYTPDAAAQTFWLSVAHNFPPLKSEEGE